MNILFISNVFPTPIAPHRGSFNRELVRTLGADHEIRVVCPIGWTEPGGLSRNHGGQGATSGSTTYVTYYYVPRMLYSGRDVFMWWSIRSRVRALTHRWRPDVVLAFWAHPDGDVARRVAIELDVPFVQIIGGSDVLLPAPARRKAKIVRTLVAADAVITVSEDLRRRVVALGVDARRVVSAVLPISTVFTAGDRQRARCALRLAPDIPVVLWVGRMVRVKGLEVLIAAMRRLASDMPAVRLYLIGRGTDERRIHTLVRHSGLQRVVRFVGTVSHDQLPDWYRAADVTALSSYSEGVPNVLIESAACGTPFVATDVGGVSEIANPSVDRIVTAGDATALADALFTTLSRRTDAPRHGRTLVSRDAVREQFGLLFERVRRHRRRSDSHSYTAERRSVDRWQALR